MSFKEENMEEKVFEYATKGVSDWDYVKEKYRTDKKGYSLEGKY